MQILKRDPVFGKNLLKMAHKKKRWWGWLLNEDQRFASDSEAGSESDVDSEPDGLVREFLHYFGVEEPRLEPVERPVVRPERRRVVDYSSAEETKEDEIIDPFAPTMMGTNPYTGVDLNEFDYDVTDDEIRMRSTTPIKKKAKLKRNYRNRGRSRPKRETGWKLDDWF